MAGAGWGWLLVWSEMISHIWTSSPSGKDIYEVSMFHPPLTESGNFPGYIQFTDIVIFSPVLQAQSAR